MFNFDNSKKVFLAKKDKSNKGSFDYRIIELCNDLNNKRDYFTTSSCSGRIVLIRESKKKMPGLILFRNHDIVDFNDLKRELSNIYNEKKLKKEKIYFKQEPCLLVASCRDKNSQWKLFSSARNHGWKKSGILSLDKKFLVELISTENISFPIYDKGRILVDDFFLKIALKTSNVNLKKGWSKINRLREIIKSY